MLADEYQNFPVIFHALKYICRFSEAYALVSVLYHTFEFHKFVLSQLNKQM